MIRFFLDSLCLLYGIYMCQKKIKIKTFLRKIIFPDFSKIDIFLKIMKIRFLITAQKDGRDGEEGGEGAEQRAPIDAAAASCRRAASGRERRGRRALRGVGPLVSRVTT